MTLKLASGATIAVIAPAGPPDSEGLAQGMGLLRRWGFRVVEGTYLHNRHLYTAGNANQRGRDLNWALSSPEVDAVWIARGGYGCIHCLAGLNEGLPKDRPVIGFSDVTSLFAALHARQHSNLVHGPMLETLATVKDESTREAIRALLTQSSQAPITARHLCGPTGAVSGPLIGGNLTVLASITGTQWSMKAQGAIVLLEDVTELAYRLDRSVTQLLAGGVLRNIRAIVLGQFLRCPLPEGACLTIESLLGEWLAALEVPVFAGAEVGHGETNLAWRYGGHVTIEDGILRADECVNRLEEQ